MYNNKTYETHIITSPNKRDVAVQRVYKILEEIKETYCGRNKIKLGGSDSMIEIHPPFYFILYQ